MVLRNISGSLRRRLPSIIAILLATSVAAYGAIAYRTARHATIQAAQSRLNEIGQHVSDVLDVALRARNERLAAAAANPVFAAYVLESTPANREAALQAVRRIPRSQRSLFEVRDTLGNQIGLLTDNPSPDANPESPARSVYDSASTGPLSMREGRVTMESGAPIVHDGKRIGSLAEIREFDVSDNDVTTITAFIGRDAGLLIGNADGSLWTDLAGNPHDVSYSDKGSFLRDGEKKIGSAAPIPNSKLLAGVDLPAAIVVGPIEAMAAPMFGVALVVIAGGALIGWMLSRTITEPLARLTTASQRLSNGAGYEIIRDGGRLPADRDDEIGTLSRAFSTMAARVQEAREGLEQQVDQRTTQLRDAMEQLRNAQKELVAKERLATIGQLSGSIGHELRNPLGVMSNAVYLLDSSTEKSPEKSREYLQLIRSQIALSEKIISDLLGFTRVKPPERTHIGVNQLLDEQLARVSFPPRSKLEMDVPGDLPPLNVDPLQIGQVLFNVLSNAVQALDGIDRDLIIRIAAQQEGNRIRLDVTDNGCGISEENLPQIFEPLFTTRARGIGLGLSLSRSLAIANGGALTATSEKGVGSTFTLVLPAATT